MTFIPTVFYPDDNLPEDVKDAGVRGPGTLGLSGEGIAMSTHKSVLFVGGFFGFVAAIAAVATVIGFVLALQTAGLDLLEIRRGGTLAGVWALVAAFAAFAAVGTFAARLFRFPVEATIPWHDVRSHHEAHTLQLFWEGKGATCVVPAELRQSVLDAMPDVVG